MTTWEDVRLRLEREVDSLEVNGFVVLGEPAPPAGPPRGLLRRREQPPFRYVQLRRDDATWLYAECVGATSFGGTWEVTEAQDAQLHKDGWYAPGEKNPWDLESRFPNYVRLGDFADRGALVRACVDALVLLGVEPSTVEWSVDRA